MSMCPLRDVATVTADVRETSQSFSGQLVLEYTYQQVPINIC